jgi:DNA-binding transcriptional regulator YiaG
MPNIATVLKAEISRVARKEIRSEIEPLRKALATCRSELAALKRRAQSSEQELRKMSKAQPKGAQAQSGEAGDAETGGRKRFSAKGLLSQRKRLGLSAEDCGLLVGASGQSVYNWEAGKARPREKHLAAISALKTLGKKSAAAHLESIRGAVSSS